MHAANLADLASTIALHGPGLLRAGDSIPAAALQEYWIASRRRTTRWHQVLGLYRRYDQVSDAMGMRAWWEDNLPTLEEILVSEILTRVYAAIGHGLDSGADEPEVSPVVHSMYVTHLEARNRALCAMISGRGAAVATLARLNRLRKITERWSDVLVGQIASVYPEAAQYGTVAERTLSFAKDAADHSPSARQTTGWLLSATIRDTLMRQMSHDPANPNENQAVCDAVLVCLRPDMFDSIGSLQSLWLHRLRHSAQQTDQIIKQLLSADSEDAPLLDGYEAVRDRAFQRRLR